MHLPEPPQSPARTGALLLCAHPVSHAPLTHPPEAPSLILSPSVIAFSLPPSPRALFSPPHPSIHFPLHHDRTKRLVLQTCCFTINHLPCLTTINATEFSPSSRFLTCRNRRSIPQPLGCSSSQSSLTSPVILVCLLKP